MVILRSKQEKAPSWLELLMTGGSAHQVTSEPSDLVVIDLFPTFAGFYVDFQDVANVLPALMTSIFT